MLYALRYRTYKMKLLSVLKLSTICLGVFIALFSLNSCVTNDEFEDSKRGNFEALWTILDEHYCFFEQKNIDWNEVKERYAKQFDDDMSEKQQFEVMANMLSELKDGHVNLYTSFNMARYWSWHENYPQNYSDSLIRKYLKTDYLIASGMDYTIFDDNIGYLHCSSFQRGIGAGNLDDILFYFQPCKALIIDIRNNGGGALTNAEELAARFTNKELLVGYMQHKTGKGHNDFSEMQVQTLKPGKGIRWQKPVVVLTNRSVYSAANEFVKYMQCCPNVTTVGDRTGGGAGLPFSSELPNGWSIRFSACPMYDKNKQLTEFGIVPEHKVGLTADDFQRGKDTIIEFARSLINAQ